MEVESVATVNGVDILQETFDSEWDRYLEDQAAQGAEIEGDEEAEAAVRTQLLDQLVNRELLLQEANSQGITAESEVVQELFDEVQTRFGGEEELIAAIEEQGLVLEDYREELAIHEYLNQTIEVEVSEEEVRQAFDAFAEQSEEDLSFEEVGPHVERRLLQQKHQQEVSRLINQLREESEIEIHLET